MLLGGHGEVAAVDVRFRPSPRATGKHTTYERKLNMARKNRLVVPSGTYHVTTRIAHGAFLLRPEEVKEKMLVWLYGIADFAGIDVLCWTFMDNHLHLLLRVPEVPVRYRLSPGTVPAAEAFTMRPRECRTPRWTPDLADPRPVITPAGDLPSEAAVVRSVADGVPLVLLPRPETGFTMSDEEMCERLARLRDGLPCGADDIRRRWARLRVAGMGEVVEHEKDALCRRMYNLSEFMKAFKQRISEHFNRERRHAGQLWEGRFHSRLVQDDGGDARNVAVYAALNPVRAGIAARPSEHKWNSYAVALGGGRFAERARRGYERLYGVPWDECHVRLESAFADVLPAAYDPGSDETHYLAPDGRGGVRLVRLRLTQLAHRRISLFSGDGLLARTEDFVRAVRAHLLPLFPGADGRREMEFLARYDGSEPPRVAV